MLALTRWLGSRWAIGSVLAVSLALCARSATIGFVTDDHGFRAEVESSSERAPAVWDLFRFSTGDPAITQEAIRFGHDPWWTAPDHRLHFARPLTSLSFAGDVAVFGDQPVGYHLDSIAWFALLLGGVYACLRRLVPGAASTIGLAAFAWHPGLIQVYAWPSARHTAIVGAFGAWAIYAVIRGGGWRRFAAPALVIAALAGGELALGVVPLWIALELVGPGRASRGRDRLVRCIAPIAIALAYVAAYHALGFGVTASAGYHDPLGDPAGFAVTAVTRVPVLVADAVLALPSELSLVGLATALALSGAIAAVVLALGAWSLRLRDLGWLALGGLGAIVLASAAVPGGRVLVFVDLAMAALVGAVIAGALDRGARRLAGCVAVLLAVVHLVGAPVLAWFVIGHVERRGQIAEAFADGAIATARGKRLFIIAAADPLAFLYARGVAADVAPHAIRCWSVLSVAAGGHRVTRTDARSFTVATLDRLDAGGDAPLVTGMFALLFRGDRPFAVGDRVEQCGAAITIADVRDGRPTAIAVAMQRRLDDPLLSFMTLRGGKLVSVSLPSVGESVDLP